MTETANLGILRDVCTIVDPGAGITTFVPAAPFADLQQLYPESYHALARILVDWLATEMPATVRQYGQSRTLAWVMAMIEIDAARLQGRKLSDAPNAEQWQFRVVFEDIMAALLYLQKEPTA